MPKQKLPYEEWIKEVAILLKCKVEQFTENAYKEEYERGLKPRQAISELYENI